MNIVITGASKGIGKALAIKYALAGHKVAVCARNEKNLRALAKKAPDRIFYQVCDVCNKEELNEFYSFIKQNFKKIDILINNAGIFMPGEIINEEEGVLEKLINTNLYSAYHMSRLIIPDMINRNSGQIFNMCSIASIKAYAHGGSYGISKFALYGMSKAMREELKPHGIRVTAVLPGATLTDSWGETELPSSRFIKPEDIAEMIYAASILSPNAVVEDIIIRPQLGDL